MTTSHEFMPVNKAHAIAEMVLFFEFSPDLHVSGVLPALLGLKDDLRDRFPRGEVTQQIKLDIQPGQASFSQQTVSGLQLSRLHSDGSLEWLINIARPAISFHCLDYTRWQAVWTELRDYVGHVFKVIGAAPISISSVGLKYVDRFVWKGPDNGYDSSLLFKKDSPLLHARAFDSSNRWHCHTGWYQASESDDDVLNQLNVDSGQNLLSGASATIVTVDHTQMLRSTRPDQLARYGRISSSRDDIDLLVQRFHDGNKKVLLALLTEQMTKRINLDGGDAS